MPPGIAQSSRRILSAVRQDTAGSQDSMQDNGFETSMFDDGSQGAVQNDDGDPDWVDVEAGPISRAVQDILDAQ